MIVWTTCNHTILQILTKYERKTLVKYRTYEFIGNIYIYNMKYDNRYRFNNYNNNKILILIKINSIILYFQYKSPDILLYNLVSNVVNDTYCQKHLLT